MVYCAAGNENCCVAFSRHERNTDSVIPGHSKASSNKLLKHPIFLIISTVPSSALSSVHTLLNSKNTFDAAMWITDNPYSQVVSASYKVRAMWLQPWINCLAHGCLPSAESDTGHTQCLCETRAQFSASTSAPLNGKDHPTGQCRETTQETSDCCQAEY